MLDVNSFGGFEPPQRWLRVAYLADGGSDAQVSAERLPSLQHCQYTVSGLEVSTSFATVLDK